MIDKNTEGLLKSMDNIIKYIKSSEGAQQQIFNTLQSNDFKKIMNNFTQQIQIIRLKSVYLLSLLIFNSINLQQKFCKIFNIYFSFQSEIILSQNINIIFNLFPYKIIEIYELLKSHHKIRINNHHKNLGPLIWFINPQKQVLNIQYLSEQQMQKIIDNNTINSNEQLIFDPIYCIFGVLINTQIKYGIELTAPLKIDLQQNKGSNEIMKEKQGIQNNISIQTPKKYGCTFNFNPPSPSQSSQREICQVVQNQSSIKTKNYDNQSASTSQTQKKIPQHYQHPNSSDFKWPTIQRNSIKIKTIPPIKQFSSKISHNLTNIKQYINPITQRSVRIGQPHSYYIQNSQHSVRNINNMTNCISPSQKIKNIAMNGRQGGLEMFRNVKLLTPQENRQINFHIMAD